MMLSRRSCQQHCQREQHLEFPMGKYLTFKVRRGVFRRAMPVYSRAWRSIKNIETAQSCAQFSLLLLQSNGCPHFVRENDRVMTAWETVKVWHINCKVLLTSQAPSDLQHLLSIVGPHQQWCLGFLWCQLLGSQDKRGANAEIWRKKIQNGTGKVKSKWKKEKRKDSKAWNRN